MQKSIGREHASFSKSLKSAFRGIVYAFNTESHLRFHFLAALAVLTAGFLLNITGIQWLFIIYAVGSVIVAELLNTALENTVDLIKAEFHPLAGKAKDIAAGAVLVAAVQAVLIGLIVFGPYIIK